jgi:signal transduction histidine kinase
VVLPLSPSTPPPGWIALQGESTQVEAERPLRTRRIFAQVIAGAAVVIVAVGVVGAFASQRLAERQSVNDAARTTDLLGEVVVQPALDDGLLTGTPAALAKIDAAVRAHVLGPSIVRVKIWGADGRVLYSDESRAIGLTFPLGDDEHELLTSPSILAQVTDLQRPENRFEQQMGKLLEVYRPVWTPSGQPLLFETYAPYSAVTDRSTQLWRGFAGVTLTSLLLLVLLMLPILWRLLDRLKRAQGQREALLEHAVEASDSERRRIAATLHDGVVQELAATSFVVAGEAAKAESVGEHDLAARLRAAAATVRHSIGGLRSLLVDIYPPSLATAGLPAALEDLVDGVRSRGTEITLDVEPAATVLDPETERLVFRVAQECLRNVVRHAAGSPAAVVLSRQDGHVVLEVSDQGPGFDPVEVLARPGSSHFGLRVLGDVAARAGATMEVASAPGHGTRWRLRVPTP